VIGIKYKATKYMRLYRT